ncbi:MAG: PAS domain-containing protein [Rhodospirillaceae bacterium]|nr:PAS domain-containing protein [Rhodospirillaceae bacterium]
MTDPAVALDISLEEAASPRVSAFDAYWRAKCADGRLPMRSAIDPAEIKPLLPFLLIAEIETAPFRVRYRLDGSQNASINGPFTNQYLDELEQQPSDLRNVLSIAYQTSVGERRPVYCRHHVLTRSGVKLPASAGIWPLADADGSGRVTRCVGLEDYPDLG